MYACLSAIAIATHDVKTLVRIYDRVYWLTFDDSLRGGHLGLGGSSGALSRSGVGGGVGGHAGASPSSNHASMAPPAT